MAILCLRHHHDRSLVSVEVKVVVKTEIAAPTPVPYADSCAKDFAEGVFQKMWAKWIFRGTLLPLLIHSIFGCCWHHVHNAGKFQSLGSSIASHVGHSHGDRPQRHHAQWSEDSEPIFPTPCRHDKPCDDVRCVYIEAEFVRLEFFVTWYEHVAALNVGGMMYPSLLSTTLGNPNQTQKVLAVTQHCALKQVWVV